MPSASAGISVPPTRQKMAGSRKTACVFLLDFDLPCAPTVSNPSGDGTGSWGDRIRANPVLELILRLEAEDGERHAGSGSLDWKGYSKIRVPDKDRKTVGSRLAKRDLGRPTPWLG